MTKETEKVLLDFFQAFRVAIFNASIYSTGHSVFRKSLEEFKKKSDAALAVYHPLEIMIAPKYLLVGEQKFEKDSLYEDLAKFLHYRSIKSVKFQEGATLEELDFFLTKASLRIRNIIKEGGLQRILKTQQISRIHVEMLDYSQILKGNKEDKDIWAYLLQQVVEEQNDEAIEAMVDNFGQMVSGIGVKEVLTNQELQESMVQFLNYLRDKKELAFAKCAQTLLRTLVRGKSILKNTPVPENFKQILQILNASDIAAILMDEMLISTEPDVGVLEAAVLLLEQGKHDTVASALLEKIQNQPSPKINSIWLTHLTAGLKNSSQPIVQEVYHSILSVALTNITQGDSFHCDVVSLPRHLQGALFYMIQKERRVPWLSLLVDKVLEDLQSMPVEKRIEYGRSVVDLMEDRHRRSPLPEMILLKTYQALAGYVEEIILDGEPHPELEDLVPTLKSSGLSLEYYMTKIFQERKISPDIVRLFMKFFPGAMAVFQQNLNKCLNETRFMLKLLECTSKLDPPETLAFLKAIFVAPNPYVRAEILNIMSGLALKDKEFLLTLLRTKNLNVGLKESALSLLKDDPQAVTQAVNILLPASTDKSGVNLEENIKMIGRAKLTVARPRLKQIGGTVSFWQKSLRTAISQALEQLNHE